MRIYLTFHLLVLIIADQKFRHLTGPTGADRLNQLMWFAFVLSCVASVWVFARFLARASAFRERAITFLLAWVAFYFLRSGGIILGARITYNRMMRLTDEVFLLFTGSLGTQFEVWSSDAHFHFLVAILPIFMVAAVFSLGVHFVSRHLQPHGHPVIAA